MGNYHRVAVDDVLVSLALEGHPQLTANCRERRIIVDRATKQGWTASQVAEVIGLTRRTVEYHRQQLRRG